MPCPKKPHGKKSFPLSPPLESCLWSCYIQYTWGNQGVWLGTFLRRWCDINIWTVVRDLGGSKFQVDIHQSFLPLKYTVYKQFFLWFYSLTSGDPRWHLTFTRINRDDLLDMGIPIPSMNSYYQVTLPDMLSLQAKYHVYKNTAHTYTLALTHTQHHYYIPVDSFCLQQRINEQHSLFQLFIEK